VPPPGRLVEAQLELGICFTTASITPAMENPALTWYMLAANQGNARAAGCATS